jgi:hypothetical protein
MFSVLYHNGAEPRYEDQKLEFLFKKSIIHLYYGLGIEVYKVLTGRCFTEFELLLQLLKLKILLAHNTGKTFFLLINIFLIIINALFCFAPKN